MIPTNTYANSPRDKVAADDRRVEAEGDRLAKMSREEIEAEYGPMSDEEYQEVFGND